MWQWMPRRRDGTEGCGREVYREGGEVREETETMGLRWLEEGGGEPGTAWHVMYPLSHWLTPFPPRASRRHCRRPLRPVALHNPLRFPPPLSLPPHSLWRMRVCIWKILARVRPLISRRARYTYPAASSYEVFVPACLESRRRFRRSHAPVHENRIK